MTHDAKYDPRIKKDYLSLELKIMKKREKKEKTIVVREQDIGGSPVWPLNVQFVRYFASITANAFREVVLVQCPMK